MDGALFHVAHQILILKLVKKKGREGREGEGGGGRGGEERGKEKSRVIMTPCNNNNNNTICLSIIKSS